MEHTESFNVELSKLPNVITDKKQLFDDYFYYGHPMVQLPDAVADDAHIVFSDYVGTIFNLGENEDSNGGEFGEFEVDAKGLVTVKYFLHENMYAKDADTKLNLELDITGYVMQNVEDNYFALVVATINTKTLEQLPNL